MPLHHIFILDLHSNWEKRVKVCQVGKKTSKFVHDKTCDKTYFSLWQQFFSRKVYKFSAIKFGTKKSFC
jgi:hypothetical protein